MDSSADTPPVDRDLLDLAVTLARKAGHLARERFFAGPGPTTLKADGTEVTTADVAVEELVRDEVARHAPGDEVYGEERGTTPGTTGRRWVVDPIDGTYFFVRRIALFTTTLAVEDEHGPAVGIVYNPVTEELVHAGRGRGCFRTAGPTERVRVSRRTRFLGARTAMGNPGTWSTELMTTLHRSVFLSTVGDSVGVATGQVDASVVAGAPMGYEDVAPLPVIVGEAGGRVTDLAGNPVLTGNGTVLATNGVLHDEYLALVAGIDHGRDWRALAHG